MHALLNLSANVDVRLAILFLLLAVLLLIWGFWPAAGPAHVVCDVDVPEGEYDYMNTAEAMPAKLDLARAYIEMGEHDTARTLLRDISEKGDVMQKQAARSLIERL